ncbi:MAG: hypothetical protein JXA33_07090 [Anaerolineae bacterium]|nr:hypothetical protein [Anaerolineae bacterium]
MYHKNKRLVTFLIAYYGVLEIVHLCILAWAGLQLVRVGEIGFPAPPPPGGWSVQARSFLIATGVADAVNIVLALLFVYGYFTQAPWWRGLGTITLTATAYSGFVFVYGTIATGAWIYHPVVYWGIVSAFVPIILLMVVYIWTSSV